MNGTGGQVLLSEEGQVWHVTLSNPAKRNAVTWDMYDQLEEICLRARKASDLRVLVLRGDGGQAFAAGTDIRQFVDFNGAQGVAYEARVGRVLAALLDVPVPVVAVVEGPAVGAGLAIAACSDLVLASTDAVFGAPVARTLGNCLPALVIRRLQRRMGVGQAMALLLTSALVAAEQARVAGLVLDVVDRAGLDERVSTLVARLCAAAPLTLAAFKEIDRRIESAEPAVDADDILDRCYGSTDFREGVQAFLEHRKPRWEGR